MSSREQLHPFLVLGMPDTHQLWERSPESQQVVDAAAGPLPGVEGADGEVGHQLDPLGVALQAHLRKEGKERKKEWQSERKTGHKGRELMVKSANNCTHPGKERKKDCQPHDHHHDSAEVDKSSNQKPQPRKGEEGRGRQCRLLLSSG